MRYRFVLRESGPGDGLVELPSFAALALLVGDLVPTGTTEWVGQARLPVWVPAAAAAAWSAARPADSYTCRACGSTSFHPVDLEERYCGACHAFADKVPLELYSL